MYLCLHVLFWDLGIITAEFVVAAGGNRGIGYAAVAAFWKLKEYHTIMACRNKAAGEEAAKVLRSTEGAGLIEVMRYLHILPGHSAYPDK